jgi:glutamate dehydrogenase
MKIAYQQQQSSHLEQILAALPRKTGELEREFVRQFYARVPLAELEQMPPARAAAVALSALAFFDKRMPGEATIRVFTPDERTQGYGGKHVVIELANDDRPFLVDSLSAELTRHGLVIHTTLHPTFAVERDRKGVLTGLARKGQEGKAAMESLIHFEVTALPDTLGEDELVKDLHWVLAHVQAAVDDWQGIVTSAEQVIADLSRTAGAFAAEQVAEVTDFLRWLVDRNFIFLGYGRYDFYDAKGRESIRADEASLAGIMKITEENTLRTLEQMLREPELLEITKSSRRSPVHRPVPMDYIGVKRIDAKGRIVGEHRFLGLFTSNVYYQSTDDIPLVRRKVAGVLARSGFEPQSHDGKALKTILEFLPRDEIFQMNDDELFDVSMGIFSLESRPGVRMFARTDAFERFVSIMVFVPRELFSTDLRKQIQGIVAPAYNGDVSTFSTQITEAPLARLHLMVKTTPGDIPTVDVRRLEMEIAKRAYLWSDLLSEALTIKYGEERGEQLRRAYATAFTQGYINRHDAMAAAHDIGKIEEAKAAGELALELFQSKADAPDMLHLKIYNPNEQIALSDILPLLENAGFRAIEEHPFQVSPAQGVPVWIRDFKLQVPGGLSQPLEEVRPRIEEALLRAWSREMDNDRFNALVLKAGLSWREVVMLRAFAKYLKQVGFAQQQAGIEQALGNHPLLSRLLADLFAARFAPQTGKDRAGQEARVLAALESGLAQVTSAVEDLIIRRYIALMQACLRTNYYQQQEGGAPRAVLSFKFASAQVPELPKPHPYAEIFVYSPRVEGIHLRGGRVARGGLRWSDRLDDFRTEVLGLMKAQMVKNSVIVPVGSKGGFVVKRPPASREAYLEEGIACYKMYLSGLLDLTDNIVSGAITPPKDVVRHDDDDPYLVVAADKGTATFSDIANGVSAEYGFWLGDAFASGGSAGYDHKKMGITARGGWVSVARHFAEMGVDIQQQDFTCVGIGDMAGDVFGNGMLLSAHIRLLAAFNHQHIFLDPAPDAKKSFAERERLFALPRSTWKDYDEKLISRGGGVYERSAKTIEISREAQAMLGVHRSKFTPDELIRAILLAPVDLLWNGGIGTYVKAEEETNEQVGDRTNNALRVNGRDLRCKVVGEGGNLGFTQKGRIEYARAGGRINTDAIDNSAGVDCSDHEVNIKIAFSPLLASGELTKSKRDTVLERMTDEVASLVLKDNILQTQAITIAAQQGASLLDSQARLMHTLERTGLLDRAIEYLPTDKQVAEMKAQKRGLSRPEIAVLLAYSKMELYRQLLESSLPDEPYFLSDLKRYFPKAMQGSYEKAIASHRLKREIVATVMTNSLVNRAGITFYFDIAEDTGASARDVAAAYALARDAFGLRELWNEIEALASAVPVPVQVEMHVAAGRFLERATVWLLRNLPQPLDMAAFERDMAPHIAEVARNQDKMRSDTIGREQDKLAGRLVTQGVPDRLADRIAALEAMASALDIITVARQLKHPVAATGTEFFEMGARLNLFWLRLSAESIHASSHWEKLALQALIGSLGDEHRRIAAAAIKAGGAKPWLAAHEPALAAYDAFIADLKAGDAFDAARLMVALKQVRKLA